MRETEKLLNQGLNEGYAGNTARVTVQRGPFQLEASSHVTPAGEYSDQWIADRLGGGQEIAQAGDQKATRLYAGGTIGIEGLAALGLVKKDVTSKLKAFIKGSAGKTRLLEDYKAEDGPWRYSYEVMEQLDDIPLTVGMETITHNGQRVFAHGFLHSPIE